MTRAPLLAVIAAVLLGLAAPAAHADTICVFPATGCDSNAVSVAAALASAGTHPGADTVRLGGVVYSEDNLSYSAPDPVTIEGTGPATTLQRATAATGSSVTLQGGGAPMTVRNLTVREPSADGAHGIVLGAGGTIDGVSVLHVSGESIAIQVTGPSTVSNSEANGGSHSDCVEAFAYTDEVVLEDSHLSGCYVAIDAQSASVLARRMDIFAVDIGLSLVGSGNSARLDDSLVLLRAGGSRGAQVTMSGSASNSLTVNHSTLIATDASTIGIEAFNAAGSGTARAMVFDSILRGFGTSLSAGSDMVSHPAELAADYNNYDGVSLRSGSATLTTTHATASDPKFVNPGIGNFRLQATSPLIDADPTPLLGSEPPTDFAGTLRIVGAGRDLGAYERPLDPSATAGDVTDLTPTTATLHGIVNSGGATGAVNFRYGPTAAYGTTLFGPPIVASLSDQAQSVTLTGLTPATTYHYDVVVGTSTGMGISSDRTFTTPARPAPSSGEIPGGGATTAPVLAPAAPAQLTDLALTPARFRAARRGGTLAASGSGAALRFGLSAAGTVRLQVERAVPGTRVGGRCLARARGRRGRACSRYIAVGRPVTRDAAAGTTSLTFTGRVGGKALAPGRYRLTASAPSGSPRSVTFQILAR